MNNKRQTATPTTSAMMDAFIKASSGRKLKVAHQARAIAARAETSATVEAELAEEARKRAAARRLAEENARKAAALRAASEEAHKKAVADAVAALRAAWAKMFEDIAE